MRKHILLAIASAVITGVCCQTASAQLPGNLKIPKVSKPKPTPAPTAQPVPPGETQPAVQPQPSAPAASGAPAQSQPAAGSGPLAVLKNLVGMSARTVTSYKGDGSTYSWTPLIMFDTNGPRPSGAGFYATVSLPGGAPWVEMDCKWENRHYQCGGPNVPEDKGTTATGVFPFAIKMRNELQGTDQTLFTGKIKIDKAPGDNGTPAERAKKSFYFPNYDWALPIGYVYYSPADNFLSTAFWTRGDTYNLKPYVFYQGKELARGASPDCRTVMEVGDSYIRSIKPAPRWNFVECSFRSVLIRDKGEQYGIPLHHLMSSPGEYEIKVLWNNELSRSIKFNIGPDGQLTGGVPLLYKVRDEDGDRFPGVVVPVAILDGQDGPWDRNAWKTGAFYGNPLAGFTPAP